MKPASIQQIKQELQTKKPPELLALCLRLARFKKENKELLTYLLFEAGDEQAYVSTLKSEISEMFESMNLSHLFFAKKTLRKIARTINKYSRFSDETTTELELRIHFVTLLDGSGINMGRNTVISNLYQSQRKKIETLIGTLHEDLQFDYRRQLGK